MNCIIYGSFLSSGQDLAHWPRQYICLGYPDQAGCHANIKLASNAVFCCDEFDELWNGGHDYFVVSFL